MLLINSSRISGDVAEIIQSLTSLLEDIGVQARWEVMEGSETFYQATRQLQDILQGQNLRLPDASMDSYLECNRANAERINFDADMVVTHDLHPLPLIENAPTDIRWIWRCHLDISHPQRKAWAQIRPYIIKYDAAIFSLPQFAHALPVPQFLMLPSIDPLSEKNRELRQEEIDKVLDSFGIPRDKPILLQVSKFERLKDPVGVISAFRLIQSHHECRLVLAGTHFPDDPESMSILDEVREAAGKDPHIHVLLLEPDSHLEINALQRSATIVIQKSIREGFGLTIAEAMWKGKPVIGSETGGITQQVESGQTGYVVNSIEGTAFYARYLLNNPGVADAMGRRGRDRAREKFLLTRHLGDYLGLMVLMSSR